MTFTEYWNSTDLDKYRTTEDYCFGAWNGGMTEMKTRVLKLLEENKETEGVSHTGKITYKIYGTVIDKIKDL